MSIMLIINIVLFISAICSVASIAASTGASVTSVTPVKSKRRIVDPGVQDTRNHQEQSRSVPTTPKILSPQDINLKSLPHYRSVKGPNIQGVSYSTPNYGAAYGSVPKRPLPYASTPVHQSESLRSNNLLAPYFNLLNSSPYAYKSTTSTEKPLDASIASQSLQKLQGLYSPVYGAFNQDKSIELPGFSDFSNYPSYASISKLISQSASSPTVQVPVYKTNYPLPKITDYAHVYSPAVLSAAPPTGKTAQSVKQKNEATVDVNGKKISVPIIQLQSNPDLSGVFPGFESQPFLLGANYPNESDLGFNFGNGPKLNMALQSRNVSPFLSPLSSFQGQIVPIQTANGSPQFPQYKGASIGVYPTPSNVPKAQGNYESLYSQPQLHFGKQHNSNVRPANVQQNVFHPISTEGILNDAEIINTKNPEPHAPQPDDDDTDDDKDDERYRNPEKEDRHNSEDDDSERQPGKYFKESAAESDFKPSTSYPFKEYDERFGKHSRAQSDDEDSEEKPYAYTKYKNYAPFEDDEEEKDSSSEDRAEYAESLKPSRDSYEEEDEDEEESHKHEKHEETEEESHQVKPKRFKYYQKDFEQEFDESYRQELPKQEYIHVKEVPEIDSYIDSKPKRQQKSNNRSRVNQEQSEESKDHESRTFSKNRRTPKINYKDSAAYSSDISAKKAPKVIHEEFFKINKNPEKYFKHAKTEAAAIEKYSPAKKSSKEDSYFRAAKYYKFKSPKASGEFISKNKDPYLYSSTNDWKLSKNLFDDTASASNVRQLSVPGDRAPFYGPSEVSGQMRFLTNVEILRDLTGI